MLRITPFIAIMLCHPVDNSGIMKFKRMRIFWAFLIVFVAVILFMLPLTTLILDFRTDDRDDTFSTETGAGTTANVTLLKALFDDDIGSVSIASDLATDIPLASSYNATPRQLLVSGLTVTANRTMVVTYDVDALAGSATINTFVDRLSWIWMLVVIAFVPAALAAIFTGRA